MLDRRSLIVTSAASAPVLAGAMFAGAAPAAAGQQPNMRAALDQLVAARESLQAATPGKSGHRVKAISLVEAAIQEVRLGIAAAE